MPRPNPLRFALLSVAVASFLCPALSNLAADTPQRKIERLYRSARIAADGDDYAEALRITDTIEAEVGKSYRLLMLRAELQFEAGLVRPTAKSAEEALAYADSPTERAEASLKVASVFARQVNDLRRLDAPSCPDIRAAAEAAGRWFKQANDFDDQKGLRSLAWTFSIRGEFAEAQQTLRNHVERVPDDESARWLLDTWIEPEPTQEGQCLLGAVPIERPFPESAARLARRYNLDRVEVGVVVGLDGSIDSITVIGTVPDEVATRFRDVCSQWKFEPASLGGERVRYPYNVTFSTEKQWPAIIWN